MSLYRRFNVPNDSFFHGIFKLWATITVYTLITWSICVYRFASCDFEAPYKAEVLYGISLATPACWVTAWIDFGK